MFKNSYTHPFPSTETLGTLSSYFRFPERKPRKSKWAHLASLKLVFRPKKLNSSVFLSCAKVTSASVNALSLYWKYIFSLYTCAQFILPHLFMVTDPFFQSEFQIIFPLNFAFSSSHVHFHPCCLFVLCESPLIPCGKVIDTKCINYHCNMAVQPVF